VGRRFHDGSERRARTTTYDAYGRPSQTQIPDGAVTTYTYTTTRIPRRHRERPLEDHHSRRLRPDHPRANRHGGTIVSTVDTQYAPCACSPLGKMSKVSQPYGPGGTVYWTTYTYDGSGRTLTVTAPDGASRRSTPIRATAPRSPTRRKMEDVHGGRLRQSDPGDEPNPAGGTFATNYTYTPANQITGVSMTRGNVTQTRTFLYNGSDLVSAANPETAL